MSCSFSDYKTRDSLDGCRLRGRSVDVECRESTKFHYNSIVKYIDILENEFHEFFLQILMVIMTAIGNFDR